MEIQLRRIRQEGNQRVIVFLCGFKPIGPGDADPEKNPASGHGGRRHPARIDWEAGRAWQAGEQVVNIVSLTGIIVDPFIKTDGNSRLRQEHGWSTSERELAGPQPGVIMCSRHGATSQFFASSCRQTSGIQRFPCCQRFKRDPDRLRIETYVSTGAVWAVRTTSRRQPLAPQEAPGC